MKDVEVADSHLAAVQKHMGSKGDIAGIYGAVRQEAGLKFENWALKLKYRSQISWDLSILDQMFSPAKSTVFKLYGQWLHLPPLDRSLRLVEVGFVALQFSLMSTHMCFNIGLIWWAKSFCHEACSDLARTINIEVEWDFQGPEQLNTCCQLEICITKAMGKVFWCISTNLR